MTKKEYIEKLENLIVQRVKYHAPKIQKGDLDYSLLEVVGIEMKYPIFLFEKPMNKVFFKAFEKAKTKVKFNLILTEKPLFNNNKIKKIDNTFLILKDEVGGELYSLLEGLNINYLSRSNFYKQFSEESLRVNGNNLTFDYLPYYYNKKVMHDGIIFDARQFLLNGKNTIINIINTKDYPQKAKIEFNLPLPRGYYFFKKGINFIEIENLTSKEKAYFNFCTNKSKFSFSNMNGIESCTFATINFTCEIDLMPKQIKKIYFNYGENKYCFYDGKSMEEFFKISQQKFNEIFDVKVQTRDISFDNEFNLYLPRKIWEKWQKFDVDEESINTWLKLKNEIVKVSGKGAQISSSFKGIKEVKFFRNFTWKRVFVLHNNSNYLFANKIKYFNYNLLTKEIFDKNNEIYLSFAD